MKRLLMTRLADAREPALALALQHAWASTQATADIHKLLEAVRTGHADGMLAAFRLEIGHTALRRGFEGRVAETYRTGAQAALEALGPRKAPFGASFTAINLEAVSWARRRAGLLVADVAYVRDAIRRLVTASQEFGIPVRVLARQVLEVIGLDARRMAALEAYGAEQWAIRADAGVVEARIQRYADRLRRQRSMVIARTETISALSQGQLALWRQAVARGLISTQRMGKRWIVTPDDKLCPYCEALDGEVVPLEAAWADDVVAPPLHPCCRCAMALAPLQRAEQAA